jgi:hypothetical protein
MILKTFHRCRFGALLALSACVLLSRHGNVAAESTADRTETAAVSVPLSAPSSSPRKNEKEFLVPPGGGAFDVPVHAGEVCILSFFEKLEKKSGLSSSKDFEIRPWGKDGVAVLARAEAKPSTFAVATRTRAVKINVTLRVVPAHEDALTLVRFKAATEEEAREAFVKAEVAKRMVLLRAEADAVRAEIEAERGGVQIERDEVAAARKNLDVLVQDRAELLVMERSLKRSEVRVLKSIERSNDNVIAHVKRAMVLGENGYLFVEIENRGAAPFRVARLEMTAAGKPVVGRVRLMSASVDKDPRMIGVVQPGATARVVALVRSVDAVMGKALALELSGPEGRGAFRLTKGITFK